MTARQWQLAHGQQVVGWLHSSGVAARLLEDICAAVEATVVWIVADNPEVARQVITQFPDVLKKCDSLTFDAVDQALAYLILHLPDRYSRMFQVLERLLLSGALPLGKSDNFAAIDIGAGPGPGIFAIRSFYAALAHYVSLHDPSRPVATLGSTDVVERIQGMPCAMPSRRPRLDVIRSSCLPGSAGRPRPSSRRPLHERRDICCHRRPADARPPAEQSLPSTLLAMPIHR
jgi:hypothetical protein